MVKYTSLLLRLSKVYPTEVSLRLPTADTSLNCLYEEETDVQDPIAVVHVPDPPTIPIPSVIPQVPAAAVVQPAVDPVHVPVSLDPVLPSSSPETSTVEHQSILSPLRQSTSDQRPSDKADSATNPVVPALSLPSPSMSTPTPPRGSRCRPHSTAPRPPLEVPRSSTHAYDTRRKHNPLPTGLMLPLSGH